MKQLLNKNILGLMMGAILSMLTATSTTTITSVVVATTFASLTLSTDAQAKPKGKPPKGKTCPKGAEYRGGMCRMPSDDKGACTDKDCSTQASPGGECSCAAKKAPKDGGNKPNPSETTTPDVSQPTTSCFNPPCQN